MSFSNHDPLVHRIEYCFFFIIIFYVIQYSLSENDMHFIILEPYETHDEK